MTSATLTVFETAIGLATQAVHQDKSKNYSEAARCYKEAIDTFHLVKSKSGNLTVSKAIDEKIHQYRERLKRIEKYLLSKQDLSQLFKSVVNYQQSLLINKEEECLENGQRSSQTKDVNDEHGVEHVLQRGLAAIEKAKRRDAKHNYSEALKFYEEGMVDLLAVAVDKQNLFPEHADVVKYKCLLIHERISAIYEHLETGAPIADRKDSNLEAIRDDHSGYNSRHHSGNSNGFDSCSASPEPLLNTTSSSLHATTTTIEEEYDEEDEDHLLLMEEIKSSLSLASISAATSTTLNPVNFVSTETDTFQKAASEAGSRHSLYPMCEIKRSPSLMSGHSDVDILNGKIFLDEKRGNVIPLADLDQELCISSFSLKDGGGGEGVDRSDGVKSASMLSSASSCNSLSKHKYRSFHSSAEDVLAAYAVSLTPESVKNYSYSEKDRNVSELTYVNTTYIDPVRYKELCLNDSEGSDSGISSDPSPKNSAREPSSSSTPTMNANDTIQEELRKGEEEIISRTLSEHSLCESEGENRHLLLTVASVNAPDYSGETNSKSNPNITTEDNGVESQPWPATPTSNSKNINATNSTSPTLKRESQKLVCGENDNEQSPKFLTPSPPLSRGGSKSSKKSQMSRPEEDELTVLSAEEVVEVDGVPVQRPKSPKVKELQIKHAEVYGRPRPEYVPPRAFARRPNEPDDDEGINKGCYYFMSCLDAFWIL